MHGQAELQVVGCTPLGPVGWATAVSSAAGATALGMAIGPLLDRIGRTAADA